MNQIEIKLKWFLSYCNKAYVMGCKVPTNSDLNILYSSNNFVVVNKQCDIPINSDTPENHPITVATQLNHAFPHLADPSVKFGFRFCHRLDYSTSGVLCIALNKKAAQSSSKAFISNRTNKYYLALLHGHVQNNRAVINKAIGYDSRPDFSHCMCTSDKEYCINPRWAVSKMLVLQRGEYNGNPATKVLMKLESGRRHQLRIHCFDIGHTIVGDYTYSNRTDILPYRMFLHSLRLVLPCDIEPLDVSTEDPFSEHEPRNLWHPTETVNELNKDVFSLI